MNKPLIRHMASFVCLRGYGSGKKEWSVSRKLQEMKKAGYHGLVCRTPPIERHHLEESGLLLANTMDIGALSEIRPKLKHAREVGATCVNVQLLDHDTPVKKSIHFARRIMEAADSLDVDVSIEMHRDTCTETPEKMYAIAEGFEKAEKRPLKITWDFSHPALIKHLRPPYWERLAERPDLIKHANQFHFRPFNGHHCQIPVTTPSGRLTPEFRDWLDFADKALECWLQPATPGRVIYVCPELIGGGYTLSTFPDRWKDAQTATKAIHRLWNKHLRKWKAP